MLPLPVLEKAASEMTDYRGSGMSVMEMSHRSAVYEEIIHAAEANLRKLMGIPDDYKVLFLQGGATTQFSAVPLNLMNKNRKADYIVSGQFSKKAADEAARYGEVNVLASSKDRNFSYVPYVDKFRRTRIMSTSATTIPFLEQPITTCPPPAAFRWLRICPRASFPARSMYAIMRSSMPARRKIWVPPA